MFWLLAAVSAILAASAWRWLPESLPVQRRHRGGLRQTGRAFRALMRDRVFAGYGLTVAFAYASLFGSISGSSFALQEQYGLTATQVSLVFAANAGGMVAGTAERAPGIPLRSASDPHRRAGCFGAGTCSPEPVGVPDGVRAQPIEE